MIDAAIGEIKKAAIDDYKDSMYHLKVDEHLDHPGHLHDALDFLKKARQDITLMKIMHLHRDNRQRPIFTLIKQ